MSIKSAYKNNSVPKTRERLLLMSSLCHRATDDNGHDDDLENDQFKKNKHLSLPAQHH